MARLGNDEMMAVILNPLPATGSIPYREWEAQIPQEHRAQALPYLKNLKMSRTLRTYYGTDPATGERVHYITRDPAPTGEPAAE